MWNQVWKQILWLQWWHLWQLQITRCSASLSFILNKIPRVTTISNSTKAGPHRVCWSGHGGRGSKLFESSCFGCCFCFLALSSAESPIFIAFNIMVVFAIYFMLVSAVPSMKPATSWERVQLRILFPLSLPQKSFLSWNVCPNSWPKRWNITKIISW